MCALKSKNTEKQKYKAGDDLRPPIGASVNEYGDKSTNPPELPGLGGGSTPVLFTQ